MADRATGQTGREKAGEGKVAAAVSLDLTRPGFIDASQLVKLCSDAPNASLKRKYSPTVWLGARPTAVTDNPDMAYVSKSYVTRQSLTLRHREICLDPHRGCRRSIRVGGAEDEGVAGRRQPRIPARRRNGTQSG
jgi:hypothetical protein